MYKIIKPILFKMDPERAHHFTTGFFRNTLKIPGIKSLFKGFYGHKSPSLPRTFLGLDFENPIGLAAGFDKEAKHSDSLACLGFGFIEIGTVTPLGQEGNPKPRLFRLPQDEALINRMGFNNQGLEYAIENLKNRKSKLIIGGNIGKNKLTPNEHAVDDYTKCFQGLYDYVDYFVVNVSSPNTPGLRSLQDKEPLKRILSALIELRKNYSKRKAILLKIAPDLTDEQRIDIAEIVNELDLEGLVTSNTTINRSGLKTAQDQLSNIGAGGLSGAPLFDQSLAQLTWFRDKLEKSKVIIGVGGINSPENALKMLNNGADLIQIYSGLIYQGPGLIKKTLKKLANPENNV